MDWVLVFITNRGIVKTGKTLANISKQFPNCAFVTVTEMDEFYGYFSSKIYSDFGLFFLQFNLTKFRRNIS